VLPVMITRRLYSTIVDNKNLHGNEFGSLLTINIFNTILIHLTLDLLIIILNRLGKKSI